jgi:hypothetical protein
MRRVAPSLCLALALGSMLEPSPALAYIDPGTGSAVFYVVTGLIVSAYFGIRGLYYRVVEYTFRRRYRHQRCELAIHCEDPRYEITFMPVIRALSRHGIELTMFTMYERDASYEPLPPGVTHQAIEPGLVGYAYLNNIEATVLVTTTPQLDVMTFRRSRRVRHYVMLQHALGESRFVRPYAYDYFDTVMCCGPVLAKNIRRMEVIRDSRPKQLLETGLPHYEELQRRAGELPGPGSETVVLVAPSWGPLSMFEAFGVGFIADIAGHFKVVVRPHPQMRVSQPELYQRILGLAGVEVDTARTPSGAMARAHILLSDISGISHEFAFLHERPVVVIDRQLKLGGLEGELLGGDSEVKQRCSEFIVPVPPEEMPRIAQRLRQTLESHAVERLRAVRGELIHHFGSAAEVAATQLISILAQQRAAALAEQNPPKNLRKPAASGGTAR